MLTNNPAAIAIHECRLLWPNETLQCVVSLGTGRYEPTSMPQTPAYTSLKTKVVKIVQSATDTEGEELDQMSHTLQLFLNKMVSELFLVSFTVIVELS